METAIVEKETEIEKLESRILHLEEENREMNVKVDTMLDDFKTVMEKAILDTTNAVILKLNNMQDEKDMQTDAQFKTLEREVSHLLELFKMSSAFSTKRSQF